MTEDQLREATGLVAHYHRGKGRVSADTLFAIERALLVLGVRVDNPVGPPDPQAPAGGSALALKVA